jgi:hypothetical protein
MKLLYTQIILTGIFFAGLPQTGNAQVADGVFNISDKTINKLSNKAENLNNKIDRQTEKYIRKIERQEAWVKGKLSKIDSTAAKQLFDGAAERYKTFTAKINQASARLSSNTLTEYIPGLDSTFTSLKFLEANTGLIKNVKTASENINDAIKEYEILRQKLKSTDDLKKYLRERKQHLKDALSKYGLDKYLKQYNKGVWYYTAQIAEYKEALHSPERAEQKIIQLLTRIPAFKEFMNQNGMLAGIFGGSGSSGASPPDPTGLQSRVQVQQLITQQAGGSSNMQFVQQNIQNAQGQMAVIQSRFTQWGNTSHNIEMPDFKVNNLKTKSFFNRLEYGLSINTNKGRGIIPNTADIAITIGYKLNNQFITGFGLNTKTGFGNGLNKIKISYEGIGGRSYIDWKIPKCKFWLTGGYEINYFKGFKNITVLKDINAWQQSCLFGLTKRIQLKQKGVKMQFLWDALAEKHIPNTSKFLYRIIIIK